MSFRDKMRKAAGLFVELPPEETAGHAVYPAGAEQEPVSEVEGVRARTVEQLVAQSAGPTLDEVHSAAAISQGLPDGAVDFSSVYRQAGIPSAAFTAEQTLDMIAGMPKELPLETKRQTVRVTLGAIGKSIGATPETIIADASRKLAALSSYADSAAQRTAEFTTATEREIAALQAQIDEKRRAIETARENQATIQQACHAETDRLDDVLEFFILDAGPSRHAAGPTSA
jgi:hypothetical protein